MFKCSVKLSLVFASTLVLAACGGQPESDSVESNTAMPVSTDTNRLMAPGDYLGEEWSANTQMIYISCNANNTSYKEVKRVWSWPEGGSLTYKEYDPGCP